MALVLMQVAVAAGVRSVVEEAAVAPAARADSVQT